MGINATSVLFLLLMFVCWVADISGITPGSLWYTGTEVPVMQKLAWF
jgi:hypothetical protein